MEHPVTFNSHGQQVVGMLHLPDSTGPHPGVVMCHGFTGNKAESHFIFTKLARALASAGIAALRFDFRGSGDSEGLFEEMTVSGEVADAMQALHVLAGHEKIDSARIGLLGFSLGGCVAALVAGSSDAVQTTALWAPANDPSNIARKRGLDMASDFAADIGNGLALGRAFVEELPRIRPVDEIAGARGPVLILHGSEDGAVPVDTSLQYADVLAEAGVPCSRIVIDGADHTFASIEHERLVIQETVAWFHRHLGAREPAERKKITYADAGVDVHLANETKKRIKDLVKSTYTPRVLTEFGSFGGLFDGAFPEMAQPVLVASTDGVGTKLKVAVAAGKHDTVGIDIVNHCIDDILVMGARPLFFQDYIGIGVHEPDVVADIIEGLARACRDAECVLLGGEMAEMPDVYDKGEYDLAATVVGVVEKSRLLDGSRVVAGDVILGLGSDGLHTNGYSLARKLCFEVAGWKIETYVDDWGVTVGEELLRPHRSYLEPIWPLLDEDVVHGMAHITGGGLTDNVPRVLPEGTAARIKRGSWDINPVFRTLVELGNLDDDEAHHTFNMGIGMVVIVPAESAEAAVLSLRASGERVWTIGEVCDSAGQGVIYD